MRAVWLCVLLLQAWAAPSVFAEADQIHSGASDLVSVSSNNLQTVGDLSVQADGSSLRSLLKKKKSPKKSSKKSPKKSSKKSPKKSKKSKKPKKKSPVKGKPGKKGKTGKSGTPGSNGFPGTPGAPGRPGTPAFNGAPGSSGAPGQSGTPGTPGTPGRPASVASLFNITSTPVNISTTAYTGLAVDGTPSAIANGLPSTIVNVVLNLDYAALVNPANAIILNTAVLDARAAIAAAVFGPDENGVLPLYQVQLISVNPGSVILSFRVFSPRQCSSFSSTITSRFSLIRFFVSFLCPPPSPTASPSPAAGRR